MNNSLICGLKRFKRTNEYIIYTYPNQSSESCIEICANNHQPIDTRTDREKAIDNLTGVDNQFMSPEDANDLIDEVKDGKIHGMTFTGE